MNDELGSTPLACWFFSHHIKLDRSFSLVRHKWTKEWRRKYWGKRKKVCTGGPTGTHTHTHTPTPTHTHTHTHTHGITPVVPTHNYSGSGALIKSVCLQCVYTLLFRCTVGSFSVWWPLNSTATLSINSTYKNTNALTYEHTEKWLIEESVPR